MTSDWPPAEYRLPDDKALEELANVPGDTTTAVGPTRQLTLFEEDHVQADDDRRSRAATATDTIRDR